MTWHKLPARKCLTAETQSLGLARHVEKSNCGSRFSVGCHLYTYSKCHEKKENKNQENALNEGLVCHQTFFHLSLCFMVCAYTDNMFVFLFFMIIAQSGSKISDERGCLPHTQMVIYTRSKLSL